MKQYRVIYNRVGQPALSAQVNLELCTDQLLQHCGRPYVAFLNQALLSNSVQLWLLIGYGSDARSVRVAPTESLGQLLEKLNHKQGETVQFQWVDPNHPIEIHYKASRYAERRYTISALPTLPINQVVVRAISTLGRPIGNERPTQVKFELSFLGQTKFETLSPTLCYQTKSSQIRALRIVDDRISTQSCHFTVIIGGREAATNQNPSSTIEACYRSMLIPNCFGQVPPCQARQYSEPVLSSTRLNQLDPLEPICFLGEFCHVVVCVRLQAKEEPLVIRRPAPANWTFFNLLDELFFDPNELVLSDLNQTAYSFPGDALVSSVDWTNCYLTSYQTYEPVTFEHPMYSVELFVCNRETIAKLDIVSKREEGGRLIVQLEPPTVLQWSERSAQKETPLELEGYFNLT